MRRILLLTIISSLLSASLWAQRTELRLIQQVDALLDDAYSLGLFTGELAISRHGEPIYYRSLGYADWQSKRPIEKNTLFNIASLNKQFTEEMIHQLVEEQKLSYNDLLSSHLDGFPEEIGSKVTIQQLLDMTSGMGDYLNHPAFRDMEATDFSLDDLMELIKSEPLLFEPGTDQAYSNSGYAVLGAVIEKVSGSSYQDNLRQRIFNPLGMKNMYYTRAEKEGQENRAFGTQIDFEGNKKSFDDISNSSPAGGLYTNITDLMKFTVAKMNSVLPSGRSYGKGMFAGGTPFWNSTISYDETTGYTCVIMANTGNISDELAPRINAIINNEPYPPLNVPFDRELFEIINKKGYDYVKMHVEDFTAQRGLPYDSQFLNFYGYNFLFANRADIAIELFKINVELFPKDANTYDSLAEAYLESGDRANALKYYRSALEKNPKNEAARKIISKLAAEK